MIESELIQKTRFGWELKVPTDDLPVPSRLDDIIHLRLNQLQLTSDENRILQILSLLDRPISWAELIEIVPVDPFFLEELERNENTLLAIEYIKRLSSRSVFVSDQDVLEEYERGKNKEYEERVNKKAALAYKPKALEFDDVKDEIYKELVDEVKLKRAQEWKEQIFKEYDFKIDESKFEGA